jgi:hypothetical protein
MPLVELPMGLLGRVFGSQMPFGDDDPNGELIQEYRAANMAVIVVLANDDECLAVAGQPLRDLYTREGFGVIYLPICDLRTPARRDLETAVDSGIKRAKAGANVVVHCRAGVGRTGMFLAAFRKRTEGCAGDDAVAWVRQHIPNAVETPDQRRLVRACFTIDDQP